MGTIQNSSKSPQIEGFLQRQYPNILGNGMTAPNGASFDYTDPPNSNIPTEEKKYYYGRLRHNARNSVS